MEERKDIFAKRLKSAREMKRMSMVDLSDALERAVSPQAIYKYEAGKMLPNSNILASLSSALSLPMEYFFRPYNVCLSGIEFRKRSRLQAKERKRIESISLDNVERYVEIEDICGVENPEFRRANRIVRTEDDVVAVVSNLRTQWGLGEDSIPNVMQLLENHGVILIEIDADDAFDGLSGMANDIPVIVLNSSMQTERKRFTALHELGHLIMNMDETHVSESDQERLCHRFASEMLISGECFAQVMNNISLKRIALQDLAEVQKKYGISIDAILYRAKSAGIIPESKLRSYHILKNQRPQFKEYAEKTRIAAESGGRFEFLVLRAYERNLIDAAQAAAFMNTTKADISARTFII